MAIESRTRGGRRIALPAWVTQSKRWWPALHLIRHIAVQCPQVWDAIKIETEECVSSIDFDQITSLAWSVSWRAWRLARLARALHTREHGIDVIELVDGLEEADFRVALEAIASAGPLS